MKRKKEELRILRIRKREAWKPDSEIRGWDTGEMKGWKDWRRKKTETMSLREKNGRKSNK